MAKWVVVFVFVVSLFWILIPQILFVVSWSVGRLFNFKVTWTPWAWTSVALLSLWWILYAYGHYYGRFRFEVKTQVFEHPNVPDAFNGYRIVQISDLHLDGWKEHPNCLQNVVNEVNSLHPDLVCFTGDLVSMSHRELDGLLPILQGISAKDGVVSVLGNHDYSPYLPGLPNVDREKLVDTLVTRQREELGWELLLNQSKTIVRGRDSIAIIGVENQSCGAHQVIRRGNLKKAMEGTKGMFSILLSHDPSHWRGEVLYNTDIPLTLSGHTHAMQMRFFGWTPSKWIYPECDGWYEENGQKLYVNIGIGGTLPMRIGATPEITQITLRKFR